MDYIEYVIWRKSPDAKVFLLGMTPLPQWTRLHGTLQVRVAARANALFEGPLSVPLIKVYIVTKGTDLPHECTCSTTTEQLVNPFLAFECTPQTGNLRRSNLGYSPPSIAALGSNAFVGLPIPRILVLPKRSFLRPLALASRTRFNLLAKSFQLIDMQSSARGGEMPSILFIMRSLRWCSLCSITYVHCLLLGAERPFRW